MSDSEVGDPVEEGLVEEQSPEGESSTEALQAITDSEEVTPDELGIDLSSLDFRSSRVLGEPNRSPKLTTGERRPVGRPPKEDEGLFNWCEQFDFTPGVELIKVLRLYPKTWEGLGIGGFIEEVYEPIDEHWLADRWGGGSYQLEAYQRDSTGRSRKTQVRTIEISGVPRAYMGNDGVPHLLPSHSQKTSSRRVENVLRRRRGLGGFLKDREGDDGSEEELNTRSIDKPLTDASHVYKMMQEKRQSESEALGVLRAAQQDVQTSMERTQSQQAEMYRTLLEQQKEEVRRLREESARAMENSNAPYKDMLHLLQGGSNRERESMEALKQAHESHIENLRRSFESRQTELIDELNRVRTSYSQDIERIRSDYQEKEKASKDDAFRQYQTQITLVQTQNSELRERHRDELANLSREKGEVINLLRQELGDMRQALMAKEHEGRMSYMEQTAGLRSEFGDRERALQERVSQLEAARSRELLEERARNREEFEDRYNTKLAAMRDSYEARLEQAVASADLKVKSAETSAKAAIEITKKEVSAQYSSQVARLESQLESLKSDYQAREQLSLERSKMEQTSAERDKENQRMILESTASQRAALAELTQKQLENRVLELTKELEHTRQESRAPVPDTEDPFEQLEKLNAIKQKLKDHGFKVDEDDGGEEDEKPKGVLDKVLKYGPQIIGPILQRVDAATAVAQQAVSQQTEQQEVLKNREQLMQQQRALEMERQAASDREVALRERREMLLRRRLEREQAIEQEDARAKMAQQIQELREPIIPEPEPELEPDSLRVDDTEAHAIHKHNTIEESRMSESTENDGYTKLANYLNEAIEHKKSSSVIVGELKMALAMRMFNKETLKEVLDTEFEALVKTLSDIHPRLGTPRARIVLGEVMEGMKE